VFFSGLIDDCNHTSFIRSMVTTRLVAPQIGQFLSLLTKELIKFSSEICIFRLQSIVFSRIIKVSVMRVKALMGRRRSKLCRGAPSPFEYSY
jgi:hypothetical protein